MDTYSVRSAPRQQLIAELGAFADDRETHGKLERAATARIAAQQLADGAESAFFERVYYCVGEPGREGVVRRPRELVAEELSDAAAGWEHLGKPGLAQEASRALAELATGADRVQVGHIVYDIAD